MTTRNSYFFAFIAIFIIFVVGFVIAGSLFEKAYQEKVSPNEQTLNAYATFESTCYYRGYDRNECLLIWSGR